MLKIFMTNITHYTLFTSNTICSASVGIITECITNGVVDTLAVTWDVCDLGIMGWTIEYRFVWRWSVELKSKIKHSKFIY